LFWVDQDQDALRCFACCPMTVRHLMKLMAKQCTAVWITRARGNIANRLCSTMRVGPTLQTSPIRGSLNHWT